MKAPWRCQDCGTTVTATLDKPVPRCPWCNGTNWMMNLSDAYLETFLKAFMGTPAPGPGFAEGGVVKGPDKIVYVCVHCNTVREPLGMDVPCVGCGQRGPFTVALGSVPHMFSKPRDGVKDVRIEAPAELLWEQSWAGNIYRALPMRERLLRAERALGNDAAAQTHISVNCACGDLQRMVAVSTCTFLLDMADEAGYQLNRLEAADGNE